MHSILPIRLTLAVSLSKWLGSARVTINNSNGLIVRPKGLSKPRVYQRTVALFVYTNT